MSVTKALKAAAGALLLGGILLAAFAHPAAAQELSDYFQFTYDPVTFNKSEITGGEAFHANVAGRAVCTADLPMSPSEAKITSKVVAVHKTSGVTVTLNIGYTVTVEPFPSKKDETAEISQVVPLQFPAQAAPGEYNVLGRVVKAEIKVLFAWMDVTSFFPQEQAMGVVNYNVAGRTEPLLASDTPLPSPSAPGLPPSAPEPTSMPSPEPELETPSAPEAPRWVWPLVALAGATTVFNIIWFVRHRR